MKKVLLLSLVMFSLAACGGEQSKKIKQLSNMTMKDIEKLTQTLDNDQVQKLGKALVECQTNSSSEICNKTIKEVVNN